MKNEEDQKQAAPPPKRQPFPRERQRTPEEARAEARWLRDHVEIERGWMKIIDQQMRLR